MGSPPRASATIRPATIDDLPAINAIYNHFVVQSACTFQTTADSLEQTRVWFERHDAAHPVTVAVNGGAVLGWASLSAFSDRCAYQHTVENSVYVHHAHHGLGLGGMLLADLIRRAGSIGHRSIVARIAEQEASLALHRAHGFVEVGRIREAGYKFDRWIDVVYMQRMLAATTPKAC
jgi:phosphinothricin acetyltransferase